MSTYLATGRALLTAAALGLLLLLPALAPGAHAAGGDKALYSAGVPIVINYDQNTSDEKAFNKVIVSISSHPKSVRVSVSSCDDGTFFNATNTHVPPPGASTWEVSFSTKCILGGSTLAVELTGQAETFPASVEVDFYNGNTILTSRVIPLSACLPAPPTTAPSGGGGEAAGGSGCPTTLGGVADYPDLSSGPNAAQVWGAAAAAAVAFALAGASWHARRQRSR